MKPRVRVKRALRDQIEFRSASLDQWIPKDHRVRAVWAYVESLDLSPRSEQIQAVEGGVGRDAVDPKILLALWMFATMEAVSSARHLHRLTERALAYLWICGSVDLWGCGDVGMWGCGDVGVNYHLLRDFRTGQGDVLDPVLTDTIATRIHQNIVTLETVAQDGRRVRAHAGSGSFRRQKTREECRTEAAQQVRQRREARDDDSSHEARDRRRQAAAQRAATERLQRVEEALQNLAELRQQQEQRKQGSGDAARCSTTAPEARTRKRGDGGFRPAFNVQFATDGGDSRLIVAVEVTNNGSAGGQRAPRHEHVAETDGKVPENDAVDGGFSTNEDLTKVEQRGRKVAAPMTHEDRILKRDGDPHERRQGDRDEMAAFRERLRSADAKAVLKRRPSIAECPNAECRHRGRQQFKVRGLDKVRTSTRWYVITGNFMRRRHLGVI